MRTLRPQMPARRPELFWHPRSQHYYRLPALVPGAVGWKAARGERMSLQAILDDYIEGWAEPDLDKLIKATARCYLFTDPSVGVFTPRSLSDYFKLLRAKFAVAGAVRQGDFAFVLRGPIDGVPGQPTQRFWREAPRLGLTGTADIKISEDGIIADSVAYDLNLALDVLQRAV